MQLEEYLDMAPENSIAQTLQYQPLPDDDSYREAYANNLYFEPNAWDLKLIFGQLDQRQGKAIIRQHTGITLPWTQAKILLYWLKGHLEFHEKTQGRVVIPASGVPPAVPPPAKELKEADPTVEIAYEIFNRLRLELLKSQEE